MPYKNFSINAITMARVYKRLLMVFADLIALPLALWSGYALRLSEWWPAAYLENVWWMFFLLPIAGVCLFARLGLYRAVIRFMGTQAIWAVVRGVMLLALLLWASATVFQISPFPRSIPINFALVALVYVGGSRLLIRYYYRWLLSQHWNKDAVLIYGAGGAGIQLATALSDGKEYYPVAFIDEDKSLWKATIKGLTVYSPEAIEKLVASKNVKHILLAMPNVTNQQRKSVLSRLEFFNVHVQTIPSMPELLSGQASIEQLREIQVEELLGRDPVPPMESLLKKCIEDKLVMVTGAGGSIGSELCRQIIKLSPQRLILFEMSEYSLYKIEQELKKMIDASDSGIEVIALLGSVSDRSRIKRVYQCFSIDTVYHAAAYKHVPMVEHNLIEGICNNVFGTQIVAEEASAAGVSNFILVSTDKAVRPTNIMGATKRFAELVLQGLASDDRKTVFSMVRFGNVLGSSGSVVPLFREQIASGGPVTVTHEEITRYFMTIPEAASLVLQAGSLSQGGDVFVLDMGEPVKIIDLARRMIHLSGLEVWGEDTPDGDIVIKCTGLRPAEKLYEELLLGNNVVGTEHVKIMRANEDMLPIDKINLLLERMRDACDAADCLMARSVLLEAVAGYKPHDVIVDHLSVNEAGANVVKLR